MSLFSGNRKDANNLLFILIIVTALIITRNVMSNRVAGGIVYTVKKDISIRYLLITTSKSNRWIFPKGKVKFYEFKKQAAIREVSEEAGIKAKIVFKLEGSPFIYQKSSGKKQNVELFAMEYIKDEQNWEEEQKRKRKWMTFREAISVLTPEFRRAIENVQNRLIEGKVGIIYN